MKRSLIPHVANLRPLRCLSAMMGLAAILLLAPPASQAQITVGFRCAQDYQNNWANTLDMNGLCSSFSQTVSAGLPLITQFRATQAWFYNLHGAQVAFYTGDKQETCSSCGGLDSVDFAFIATHGTIANNNPNYAGFAMWDDACSDTNPPGCIAWTPKMRLGSAGRQAKVFTAYSCDTLKVSDGNMIARWKTIFAGGLRIATGGYDLMWSTSQNDQIGQMYGFNLALNETVTTAWLNSTSLNTSNHPISVATGANSNDCWNRQGMTLEQAVTSAPLRDNQIGYYCWVYWQ